jgi:hypothetical protein
VWGPGRGRFRSSAQSRRGPLAFLADTDMNDLVRLIMNDSGEKRTLSGIALQKPIDDGPRVRFVGTLAWRGSDTAVQIAALAVLKVDGVEGGGDSIHFGFRMRHRSQKMPTARAARMPPESTTCMSMPRTKSRMSAPRISPIPPTAR